MKKMLREWVNLLSIDKHRNKSGREYILGVFYMLHYCLGKLLQSEGQGLGESRPFENVRPQYRGHYSREPSSRVGTLMRCVSRRQEEYQR